MNDRERERKVNWYGEKSRYRECNLGNRDLRPYRIVDCEIYE